MYYEFGPFRLDPVKRTLLRNGESIHLRPKAFDLLLVFIRQPGEVLTKEDLIIKVWSVSDVGESNIKNLHVTLRAVRKALDESGQENQYIVNASGSYQFAESVKQVSDDESAHSNSHSRSWKVNEIGLVVLALLGLSLASIYYFRDPCSSSGEPVVAINSNDVWTATVPVIAKGVKLATEDHEFELSEGQMIEVIATGTVNIGRGIVGPDGEPDYKDDTMDSSIKDHVGGLEMWIGPDKSSNRYFIGSNFRGIINHSGVPTFRVIESLNGYCDGNNSGSFQVTVRRLHE